MDSLSVFGAPGGSISVPRPKKTYIPEGSIERAWKVEENPHAGVRTRKSPAQKAGLAYQKRVGAFLPSRDHQWDVVAGPWYCFIDGSGLRHYCQPDFLLLDEDSSTCVVVEVKIRWTSDAWWQLRHLYLPVLRRVRPNLQMLALTITRSYDPAVRIEEPIHLIDDFMDTRPDAFNVLVFK